MIALPRLAAAVLACGVLLACLPAANADTVYDTQRRTEIARLRLHLYERVEHPAELRRLKAELTVAEAEVASLQRLLKEYRPFDKFSTGKPLTLTIESTRLALLKAELRRDNLKLDLLAQQRHHADRLRLLQLELEEARAGL